VGSDLYRQLGPAGDPVTLAVNGVSTPIVLEKGYAVVTREWAAGDEVRLVLPMPARRVVAHPAVTADAGRVAIERGPLVYAAEFADHGGHVTNLVLDDNAPLVAAPDPALLNGVTTLTGNATALRQKGGAVVREPVRLTLIPYYAWAHRGKGEMTVWLAREAAKASPVPEAPRLDVTLPAGFSAGIHEWKVR
jgi:DUF1680 family protein